MNFVRTVASFALVLRGRGTTGAFEWRNTPFPVGGRGGDRRISQEPHPCCLFGLFSDGEALGSFPQWLAQWLVARARYRGRRERRPLSLLSLMER